MPTHEFETPSPASVYVEVHRGDVRVTCTDTALTRVEVTGRDAEAVQVREAAGEVEVVAPRRSQSVQVRLTVPVGSSVTARTGSADVRLEGQAGSAHLRTGSGDVTVDTLDGEGVVECGSGDVHVEDARGGLKVRTGSGDLELVRVHDLAVSTGSGDIHVRTATGPVVVKTGSGGLRVDHAGDDVSFASGSGSALVGSIARGRVSGKVASGDVRVGIPAGVPVWTDINTLTGRIHSTLSGTGAPREGQDHVEVRATTVSGSVELVEL